MFAMKPGTGQCRRGSSSSIRPGSSEPSRRCPCSLRAHRRGLSTVNRYYDPQTGQFLSVDPEVRQTKQAYTYVGDNPIGNRDPSGEHPAPAPGRGDGACTSVVLVHRAWEWVFYNQRIWLNPCANRKVITGIALSASVLRHAGPAIGAIIAAVGAVWATQLELYGWMGGYGDVDIKSTLFPIPTPPTPYPAIASLGGWRPNQPNLSGEW